MPRGTHPNSVANLHPRPWQPGQSGNPAGRARGGAYISEWLNTLLIVDEHGTPNFTQADLKEIVADDNAAPAKVIAARRIISAMKDGKLPRGGADPEPGRDFDRIADRIEGKPAQAVHVTNEDQTTIRVVLLDRTESPTHQRLAGPARSDPGRHRGDGEYGDRITVSDEPKLH